MTSTKENYQESWILDLADFLKNRREVGAILINTEDKKVSVAMSGPSDQGELENCLKKTILAIEEKINSGASQEVSLPEGVILRKGSKKVLLKKEAPKSHSLNWVWRDFAWPKSVEKAEEHDHGWQMALVMACICGGAGLIGYFLSTQKLSYAYFFYIVSFLAGGWEPALTTLKKIPKGELDIHFLMVAVAMGAASIGAWAEGALLLFLFTFAEALEHYAMDRTRGAINSLFKMAPETARVIDESGEEVERPVDYIYPGDTIVIKPGDLFPLDAEILSGSTAADESNLTGESKPVQKLVGDSVYSGTINLWGVVKASVLQSAQESSLQKIIKLIQDAQHLKAPSQRFTDKFGTGYAYLILGITFVMFCFWWLGLGVAPFENVQGSYSAFYRAMTLLVVASPCALVLSIPSAILAAIAWGARHGTLFKGGAAIEKLSEINVVALDKTGTLTTGELVVHSVESFPKGREDEVLELAYALERNSNHPIAHAIVAHCKREGVEEHDIEEFQSLTGRGVQGQVKDAMCVLGRRELLEMGPLREWADKLPQPSESFSEVWVIYKDLLGCILLKDDIRKESKPFLQSIQKLNVRTVMLTGDRRETAEAVGREIGLQEIRSALKPEDKVAAIKEFTDAGKKVAMVGDGINDAPSLAAAYVSVAMGARGSDAALEQSEVILMNDKIENFLNAYSISLKARRIIKQNLAISLGTIILMVLAAILGWIPLAIGVFAHEGSTAFVCINSLRLLFSKKKKEGN